MDLRHTEDSCMEAMERIASVLPAILNGHTKSEMDVESRVVYCIINAQKGKKIFDKLDLLLWANRCGRGYGGNQYIVDYVLSVVNTCTVYISHFLPS